jgi:23S rRNA pseudouridine1911/1915/1917 synthase
MKRSIKKSSRTKNPVLEVKEDDTLLNFLINNLEGKSRTNIKRLLSERQILINGAVYTHFNSSLKKGDKVEILYAKVRGQEIKGLKIVFEDDELIVADKESGLLSMATNKERKKTAYEILKNHVKERDESNKIFIVHRLDKDTSGVMIFAKTPEMQQKLQSNWSAVVRERTYVAVVEGKVAKDKDTISSYLKENAVFVSYSSEKPIEGGKLAVSNYRVVKRSSAYSMVEVKLDTGRKNQIRVHMSDLGHPIIGDAKYGAKKNPIRRLGLHAMNIVFKHPTTGKMLEFVSPVPPRFNEMFKTTVKKKKKR